MNFVGDPVQPIIHHISIYFAHNFVMCYVHSPTLSLGLVLKFALANSMLGNMTQAKA